MIFWWIFGFFLCDFFNIFLIKVIIILLREIKHKVIWIKKGFMLGKPHAVDYANTGVNNHCGRAWKSCSNFKERRHNDSEFIVTKSNLYRSRRNVLCKTVKISCVRVARNHRWLWSNSFHPKDFNWAWGDDMVWCQRP